ncbi:MAG TPA: type VI secretion system ImpA family N-terminal domain-containing protein [Chiayiivirga sp.]|nr:type VI secretion system ImpA family N-terminal domain-containing protein [Chiayiivirga sp.]
MASDRTPAAGERLAGTPVALRLEELCDGKPAYYLGDEMRAEAVEPNWREAVTLAQDLMQRSADLGVLVRLAAGCLRERTLDAFVDCIEVLTALLEHHWDACYPELDVDEDDGTSDASVRLGVLGRFEDEKLMLGPLREVRIDDAGVPGGSLSLAALMASGAGTAMMQAAVQALDRLMELSDRIERAVATQSPEDADFSIYRFKETCLGLRKGLVASASGAGQAEQTGTTTNTTPATAGLDALVAGVQPARGRELAVAQIRTVIRYFETVEPSSPVIGVLERAVDLIGKDFWALMSELGDQRLVDAMGEIRLFAKK